jgi:hypothetical protein
VACITIIISLCSHSSCITDTSLVTAVYRLKNWEFRIMVSWSAKMLNLAEQGSEIILYPDFPFLESYVNEHKLCEWALQDT